ncbi:hypothetical protein [Actinomadura monticuli]|uniref:Protein kinase domain-containing protein n=1 Tax=Actinomadura monticuli TaxID=3097367 RepID=A0ABV4Q6Z8_9ACTN
MTGAARAAGALPVYVQAADLAPVGVLAPPGGQSARLARCIAPDGGEYVFKTYTPEVRGEVRLPALAAMADWRLGLGGDERAELDRTCAWPRSVVMDGRAVQGVLVRPAPAAMFLDANGHSKAWSLPRHLDALARPEAKARKLGFEYYPPPVKLAVLARVLRTMLWLHGHGYAVGDLQPRNALFSFDGATADVLLVDCDACVPLSGEPAHAQRDPADWKAPWPEPFGVRTDLYKFALLVVRSLQENTAAPATDRDRLRAVMQTRTCDVLVELCRGGRPADAVELLRDKASVWPTLVTPRALYVQTDASMRRRWHPAGAPRPDAAGPFTAGPSASPPEAPSAASSGTEIPTGFAVAVVLAIAFIVLVIMLA